MAKQWMQDNLWKIVIVIVLSAGTGIWLNTEHRLQDEVETTAMKEDIVEIKDEVKGFRTEQKDMKSELLEAINKKHENP